MTPMELHTSNMGFGVLAHLELKNSHKKNVQNSQI